MTCCDCLEVFLESERPGARYCRECGQPMHHECVCLLDGDDYCGACFEKETTRFYLVLARGAGEGREAPEDDPQYLRPLPGKAVRLAVDSKSMGDILPWDAMLAALPVVPVVDWFGGADEEDE